MEQSECGGSRNRVLDFKCKGVVPQDEKYFIQSPAPAQKKGLDTVIPSQTPEKTSELLTDKVRRTEFLYLEKCKILQDFFDSMVCSLRLLSLRRRQPTFERISTQVEILTKRKFSYRNLAQIKYILPEAINIEVEKVRRQEKELVHMKPDMIITLVFKVTESECKQSKYSLLSEVFSSRITDFYDMHPEACDIPEAKLPEPFNYVDQNIIPTSHSIACEIEQPIQASHLGPSSRRHFSRSAADIVTEGSKFCGSLTTIPSIRSGDSDNENDGISPLAEISGLYPKSDCVSEQNSPKGHDKSIDIESSIGSDSFSNLDSPQVKHASATDVLTVETPVQSMPRRPKSVSDKEKRVTTQASSLKPAKRSLNFSAFEKDGSLLNFDDLKPCDDTDHGVIQNPGAKGLAADSSELAQKVEGSHSHLSNNDLIQTNGPHFVDLISHVFQSVSSSSITKGELVHKLIMNNLDIIEKREVEEQIELLEKLAPDFISRMLAPTGDILYSIRKTADLDSVRERITAT